MCPVASSTTFLASFVAILPMSWLATGFEQMLAGQNTGIPDLLLFQLLLVVVPSCLFALVGGGLVRFLAVVVPLKLKLPSCWEYRIWGVGIVGGLIAAVVMVLVASWRPVSPVVAIASVPVSSALLQSWYVVYTVSRHRESV